MFTVYHSNQLDMLTTLAGLLIESNPLRDPFQPEIILVQSPGMAQWLQMSLAAQMEIAANIAFPLPSRFIWEMFGRVLPDIPQDSAFSKSSMTWRLMTLLPEKLSDPPFLPLRHYLQDDPQQRKLFQLASRVADLFDQYLVYRPHWLNQWEKGQLIADLPPAQCWQAALWMALVEHVRQTGQPKWHRANLYARFIKTLEEARSRPSGLPERIFICGISVLPPVYLQALQALSRHLDVHLLFTNPCRHYWGDIQSHALLAKLQSRRRRHYLLEKETALFRQPEKASLLFNDEGEQQLINPLLASWGKPGRDHLFMLAQMETQEIDVFVDIEPDSLLHTLQRDVLELEDNSVIGLSAEDFVHSTAKRPLDPKDNSVSVHLCHSPQREVEVLQDQLLAMLADDPDLHPRDIIVMVADIDAYAPFIQAVFGRAGGHAPLPFAISDRRASLAHPALQAFSNLLSLSDSRFASEEVLALLEVPAIAEKFAIDESGLRQLRYWVVEAGIRWGLDDDNVRELELPVTGQHTWRFGITRMLLGYAMNSKNGDWQGVLPYDESSGLIAELAGNLADLLMQLHRWRQWLAQPRMLTQWQPVCRQLINTFFLPDDETESALMLIETQWQQIMTDALNAGYQHNISVTLLRDELTLRLDKQPLSQHFLAGKINFCTLMPMRSIPFKVVCLLGMNDGSYPRTLLPVGFDLMHHRPDKGDRNRRDDDRYLFLEALISAREKLYISYVGRSVQDNTERYPSVLLCELMDYIMQSFCLPGDEILDIDASAQKVKEHLCYQHTRVPFAPENFLPESRYFSFAGEWLPAAKAAGQPQASFMQLRLPTIPLQEMNFSSLLRFWHHPIRAFFSMRLGVSFMLEETRLPECEPFELSGLDRYRINTELLNTLIEGEDAGLLFNRYRAAGMLPYGAFGELFWQTQQQEMSELAEDIRQWRSESRSEEINLQCDGVHLTGWLTQVQDNGLLRWRAAELGFQDGLSLWLEHLVWCAMGGRGVSRIVGRKRNQSQWQFAALSSKRACEELQRFIEGYRQGLHSPLLLPLKSAGAWLSASYDKENDRLVRDEVTQAKACAKLLESWQGSYQRQGEGSDPCLQRVIRKMDEQIVLKISQQAEYWLLPMLRHHYRTVADEKVSVNTML